MTKIIRSLLCCCLLANCAHAATFVVTNTADSGPGSLRQAILDANTAPGDDAIDIAITGTVALLAELPEITGNISIAGPGTNLFTVSGNDQVRVFSVSGGTTNTFSGLTVADGRAFGSGSIYDPSHVCASGISNAGTLKLINCVIRNCTNGWSLGTGIYNAGDLEMDTCLISECGSFYDVRGGGVFNSGVLRMNNCLITRCQAAENGRSGGGIYNTNGASLFLTNVIIDSCNGGWPEGDGGGIANNGQATILSSLISNCYGFWGGGINNYGTLLMTKTAIVNNQSSAYGGGLFLTGLAVLNCCTISSNWCLITGSGIQTLGDLKMYNCTVALNTAEDTSGTAIADNYGYSVKAGTNYLNHCTIVSNTAPQGEISAVGDFRAQNSVLGNFKGTLYSSGYNLIINTNGTTIIGNSTGDIYGVDPRLGPLQDNGGPTWTHALLPGSPAIDHADSGGLSTDQRGVPRPSAPGLSDIGAFEVGLPPSLTIAPSDTNTIIITWASAAAGYILEQTSDLSAPDWLDVGITPTDNGTTKSVLVAVSPGNRFYRLHKP